MRCVEPQLAEMSQQKQNTNRFSLSLLSYMATSLVACHVRQCFGLGARPDLH